MIYGIRVIYSKVIDYLSPVEEKGSNMVVKCKKEKEERTGVLYTADKKRERRCKYGIYGYERCSRKMGIFATNYYEMVQKRGYKNGRA